MRRTPEERRITVLMDTIKAAGFDLHIKGGANPWRVRALRIDYTSVWHTNWQALTDELIAAGKMPPAR